MWAKTILKQFVSNFGFHKKKSYRNALQFFKMSTFGMEVKHKFGFGLYCLNFKLLYLVLIVQRFSGMN